MLDLLLSISIRLILELLMPINLFTCQYCTFFTTSIKVILGDLANCVVLRKYYVKFWEETRTKATNAR